MATERPAKAKRILVVEDEPMILMLLEDMLGELGYTVAAEAARIEEALEATKNADFDLAILDANLNGQPVSPVADALVARGTPFVFATGYGELAEDRKSTRLNSSHDQISYAVFCWTKKKNSHSRLKDKKQQTRTNNRSRAHKG